MGNSKKGTAVEEKVVFTGNQQDFEKFRTWFHNEMDEKDRQWITLAAQAIAKVFQDIVAERTAKNTTTPMQTDLHKFSDKRIKTVQEAIKQYGAPVTLDLALVKNKKDVIGSAWAEADKLKITEDHLKTWHDNIDQSYIVKVNRAVLKILHNAIYPTGKANTKANQRLQHIVDTAEIRKFISGENTGDEDEWKTNLWQVPAVQVWSNLLFKFEGFTDMINGEFVNDLAGLLHDVTTSGKTQTFYDVDAKIATMGLTICKNFKEVPVFWNFFQGSVRQAMIQSLAANGQDKEAWRKAADKIADLLHDNTMLTLENTSDAVKYTETYLNREITNPDNHAAVLKADASDSKEILALKAELAELKAAQATVTTTQGGNRRFNGKRRRDGGARTADKAAVDACKTCGNRHPGRPCWTEGEKKREQALALLKEADSILATRKSNNKPSALEIKALEAAVVANKESNQCVLTHVTLAPTSTCTYVYHQGHVTAQDVDNNKWLESLARYALFDQQFMPDTEGAVLDSGAMMGIIPGAKGNGKCVQLTGVTGHTTAAEVADVVYPILTESKKPYAFATRGTTLVLTDTKDKIISLAVLLKAGFKVDFAAGTSDDLNFGGYLITPTGSRVALIFENNLWRVPLWAPPIRAPATRTMPAKVLIKSGTTNFLPAPCSTQDLKAVSTIKHIIATIQHDGFLHPLGVEQGYIGNGLRETAVNEYIKQTYGSLILFLQDSAHAQEFKVTEDKHGKFYIDCAQQPKPTCIHPADITPLDKDTASIMHQNLQKWCFPSKNIHAKIHEKYKGQVGFPKDFIWKLERHKDATVAVSMGARAYRTSKRVQQRGIHKFRGAAVSLEDGDVARAISAQDLTKLGLHIDYAHSISLGYSQERYYLILVVDGIDFVWD